MGMNPEHWQGNFGEAYVALMAAASGLTVSRTHPDVDGADLVVGYKGQAGRTRHPKIEIQVKTWSRPESDDMRWKYRMLSRQYNELAGDDYGLPRILVVVIVPANPEDYVSAGEHAITVRNLAYWVSLEHQARVDAKRQHTVAVDIPLGNLLTTRTLLDLVSGPQSTRIGR
ncbi:DUF4365 domain-containing protein [Actinosynnema sp. NPDC050436]|uniref:DUF4365 domain-containing protein n=1 Tax=Actinosynnema sp. NPDC050436 TaxID=3155659 RepID=UPI0033F1C635